MLELRLFDCFFFNARGAQRIYVANNFIVQDIAIAEMYNICLQVHKVDERGLCCCSVFAS